MKTVILVAPHFYPSFLASVHRARLWSDHLEEFGWRPIILTTDPAYYECQVDPELLDLLPANLRVIRTRAFPTKPFRLIGNLGLRSVWWYCKAIRKIASQEAVDFVHITCDSFPASLAGPVAERFLGIPYGIDYQDPWLPETPPNYRVLSKRWLSFQLSSLLEPIALSRTRLVTGINERYFSSALNRNPLVRQRAETAGMPFGTSDRDFAWLSANPRRTFLFDPSDGNIHLIYAGALLPRGHGVLERFFEALKLLGGRNRKLADRLRIHFVGTGLLEGDFTKGHTVTPYVSKWGLEHMVDEMPSRIKYLDVLNHLQKSSAILVLGSTEPHYSPSKIYQGAASRRPIFAVLHEESSAVPILQEGGAGHVISFKANTLPDSLMLSHGFEKFLTDYQYDSEKVNWNLFGSQSARESTRLLVAAMERAVERHRLERR